MKTISFLFSMLFALSSQLAAYEGSTGMSPMDLHQAYMSGKEKFAQHRFMLWQQLWKQIGDAVQMGVIGVGAGCAYKVYVHQEPESLISSPWAFRAGCAAVAFLMMKELYGLVTLVRPGFAQLALMEKDLDAEYQKQVRYLLLGETEEQDQIEETPVSAETDAKVLVEDASVEVVDNNEKNNN